MKISKITEVESKILFFLMMPNVMPISASRIRGEISVPLIHSALK